MSNVTIHGQISEPEFFPVADILPEHETLSEGVPYAGDNVAQTRREMCNSCESRTSIGGIDVCSECSCVIALKTKIQSASCPKGKW